MLAIMPIAQKQLLNQLNSGRFKGQIQGYVAVEDGRYLGFALFSVKDGLATVLDAQIEEAQCVDGAVRACLAAGQKQGAGFFAVELKSPALALWWDTFCKHILPPAPIGHIFGFCT